MTPRNREQRLFAHQKGNGFIVSGRDLVSLSAAISTESTAAFNRKIAPLLDELSRRSKDAAWSYVHEVLGDDESETLVVEPRFRLFTDAEYRAGHSRNYRPSKGHRALAAEHNELARQASR